jgi:iron complex transport system substrate-binding protein
MVMDGERGHRRRRDVLSGTGTVIVGGLLAGCIGGGGDGGDDGVDGEPATGNAEDSTGGEENTENGGDDATAGTYEACIEPSGCLTFESVPETWLVYNGAWADMAFALGQRDGFLTAGNMIPAFFFEPFGLDVPSQDELTPLRSEAWDKERFYELDPDVILIDPNFMHGTGWYKSWDESDTEELRKNVAPFFGNNCRRRREFHDYKLHTLYEAFERLSVLFQEQERYEAFAKLHEEVQSGIQSRLPPEDERPSVGLINGGSEPSKGTFYPLDTQDEGYEMKPYRDLDVASAFSQDLVEQGEMDYEKLLDIDPEIIVVHWGIGTTGGGDRFSASAFQKKYVEPMRDDPVGSQLTAVQNDAVYPGAYGEQGPIVNLLQTELKAQQLYPEEFGAFDPERFPAVPAANQLFDRQRVIDIITGEF